MPRRRPGVADGTEYVTGQPGDTSAGPARGRPRPGRPAGSNPVPPAGIGTPMCTLIVGREVLGAGTLLVAANRDEDPARSSEPPGLLSGVPHVAGGRDVLAGGTWLAVRERRAVVAVLNRRDSAGEAGPPIAGTEPAAPPSADAVGRTHASRRSRGLLALDAATAEAPEGSDGALAEAVLERALQALDERGYAPFSLAFLAPGRGWLLSLRTGAAPRLEEIAPGWHALTHADLDDRGEPRTARLMEALAGFRPRDEDGAIAGLRRLLSLHEDPASAGAPGRGAAVCVHRGRAVTVSSAIVSIAPAGARYLHAEGFPCEVAPADRSRLLAGSLAEPERGGGQKW